MSSQAPASALESAYDRLHPLIRRRDQDWEELREVRARADPAKLDSKSNVLIAATTAARKSEAAFLPVLTAIADRTKAGFSVYSQS
jgi:ATP-dependent Lhr-like helicase